MLGLFGFMLVPICVLVRLDLGVTLGYSWVRVGFYLVFWDFIRLLFDFIWVLCGFYQLSIWFLFGLYWGFIRSVFRFYVVFIWLRFDFYLTSI